MQLVTEIWDTEEGQEKQENRQDGPALGQNKATLCRARPGSTSDAPKYWVTVKYSYSAYLITPAAAAFQQ